MKLTGISRISTDSTGTDKVLKTLNNKGVSFLKTYSQPCGLVLLFYFYSIHKAICRPSDHSVERPPGRD